MREIIYLQLGNSSNYIGTHFWNIQQAYFTYGDDEEGEEVSWVHHDVSWREGFSTAANAATYTPRVLIVDNKSNYGTLSQSNELYPSTSSSSTVTGGSLWAGSLSTHTQPPLSTPSPASPPKDIRFWSSFSLTPFIPRSIHRLPDPLEGTQPGWSSSVEAFKRYDKENELVESSLRGFLEECDALQGLNVTLDSTFGGFTTALLDQFREEYPKHPILCTLVHTGSISDSFSSFVLVAGAETSGDPTQQVVPDEDQARAKKTKHNTINLFNDALALHRLNELECVTGFASMKQAGLYASTQDAEHTKYEASRYVSMMLESVSLPTRLRNPTRMDSLRSLTSLLNWRDDTRFVELRGGVGVGSDEFGKDGEVGLNYSGVDDNGNVERTSTAHPINLSNPTEKRKAPQRRQDNPFAIYASTRGLGDDKVKGIVQEWVSKRSGSAGYSSHHLFPPSPSIYSSFNSSVPQTIPLYSAYTTTPRTSSLFSSFAKGVEDRRKRGEGALSGADVEMNGDDVGEVRDVLWGIFDAYFGDGGGEEGEGDDD